MISSIIQQLVPIPTAAYNCERNGGCCTRYYCPLTLAYARTIHKFQGLSAGPVDPGKIPNMYECLVIDPDKNQCEGRALGLLYTGVSRGTTLGDDDGLNSAVYFSGQSFNESRLRGLGLKKNSCDDYLNIQRRRIWVEFLQQHTTSAFVYKNIHTVHLAIYGVCVYRTSPLYFTPKIKCVVTFFLKIFEGFLIFGQTLFPSP